MSDIRITPLAVRATSFQPGAKGNVEFPKRREGGVARSPKALRAKWPQTLLLFRVALGGRGVLASLYHTIAAILHAWLDAAAYFAALTIAIPQGPSPTLIRRNSLRDFTSTTETSFDAPFAV
jgi:hypothetical protein